VLLLHKALPVFFLPLGVSLLLLSVALLLKKRVLAGIAGAILYIASTPLFASWVLGARERQYPVVTIAACPTADAIVVLSGTLEQNPAAPDGYVWTAADRFDYGVRLYQASRAPLLMFTGGYVPWLKQRASEGDILQTLAVERGVPEAAVVITGPIQNTADEANVVGKCAHQRGLSHLILVTTAWHMPRAMLLFRRTGLRITPFPVGALVNPSAATVLDFLPQAGALQHSEIGIRELLGAAYYYIQR
jgi:uncharacterized SAM-binding protein YcdF (DUF218 family)